MFDDPKNEKEKPQPPKEVIQPEGEIGGVKGPEPTRFGDWDNNGRCTDF